MANPFIVEESLGELGAVSSRARGSVATGSSAVPARVMAFTVPAMVRPQNIPMRRPVMQVDNIPRVPAGLRPPPPVRQVAAYAVPPVRLATAKQSSPSPLNMRAAFRAASPQFAATKSMPAAVPTEVLARVPQGVMASPSCPAPTRPVPVAPTVVRPLSGQSRPQPAVSVPCEGPITGARAVPVLVRPPFIVQNRLNVASTLRSTGLGDLGLDFDLRAGAQALIDALLPKKEEKKETAPPKPSEQPPKPEPEKAGFPWMWLGVGAGVLGGGYLLYRGMKKRG